MDESWRRRRPAIQLPRQATHHLGPDDFRDVFGGPPRSVLLRHFSPSTQHADGSSIKREGKANNPPYSTVSCEPEFVSTIRCGRGGFSITRREPQMANRSVLNKEEHPSFIPAFLKDHGLPAICDDHTSFRVIERDDGSSYDTMSDFNTPAHFVHQDINCEVDDTCFEDAFVYRPVPGQHPTTWGVSSDAFLALRREDGFYSDIFGSVRGQGSNVGSRRSRSRSVSKCESESRAVSCCDEEGLLANSVVCGYEGDAVLSSYASKLRPITIPSKHYDSTPPSTISEGDGHSTLRYAGTACPSSPLTYTREGASSRNSNHLNTKNRSRCAASSFCCFTPPDTLSLDPSFRRSFKKLTSPAEDNVNSPPSVISLSVPHKSREVEKKVVLEVFDHVKSEEELNFGSEVSAALDEAIAWAKERFTVEDDTIAQKNENFVSFKAWNGTKGKDYAYSKER